ncbi:MAG: basic amino acid ABC transporter substrate-binding protein [Clostridia bacterium]|nr:basic amino acid ABC transporter substrate-binding protein [Clostridia bacterium]
MKAFVKVLALALCVALIGGVFAGCTNTTTAPSTTDDATATTAAPVAGEELVMGTNAAFPPYEFTDDQGNVVGIDAEIAQAIADKLGMTLVIKDMEFDSLLTAVAGGSIDIVLAGLTVTEERKQSVNFTDTYAKGVQVIIVKEGSAIKSVDDLEGKTIGVQAGTTGDIYCTDDFGQENVKQFANGTLAVAALVNDQVDCVVIDNEPAKNFVAANAGLAILETAYTEEDYAAAIAKENTELLDKVNAAMAELKADGTIDAIIGKYITAE